MRKRRHYLPKYIYRRGYRYVVVYYKDGENIYLGGDKKLENALKILKDYEENGINRVNRLDDREPREP